MTPEEAFDRACLAVREMNERARALVFDEVVLVERDGTDGGVGAYFGPRSVASFFETMAEDLNPLRSEVENLESPGDFGFTDRGLGTRFDAALRVGRRHFVFFNNTRGGMADVRLLPGWVTDAQEVFVRFSEEIRQDPVDAT